MKEAAARAVCLVRAFERAETPHWSSAERAWATREATAAEGSGATADRWLARRAEIALGRLGAANPAILRLQGSATWPAGWMALVVGAAALAGLAADSVGAAGRVNLLAPPFLGLLAWNLVVYLLLLSHFLRGTRAAAQRPPGALRRLFLRLLQAAATRAARPSSVPGAAFLFDWTRLSAPLAGVRIAGLLHRAAAAFAGGTIAGMYLRGLALEYRAGWESTFLDATQARALLVTILTPASRLTGIPLPTLDAFAALRFPASNGVNAAPWLHLLAATALAGVIVPRLALAWAARRDERRLEAHFPLPLDDGYFQRLLRTMGGARMRVRVLPYSYTLSVRAIAALREVLAHALDAFPEIDITPPLPLGAEDDADGAAASAPAELVVAVFGMTATAEREHHRRWLERLRASTDAPRQLIALIDTSAFVQRFGGAGDRYAERRDAWCAVFAACGCECLFLDLESADRAALASEFRRGFDAAAGAPR